mmetsp:Transcript_77835/g.225894  ORF Transcript_77835/g.225894 Transcript_77835/m.225894 type:complete len:202 (+) Transcript_77835:1577-2182(+)
MPTMNLFWGAPVSVIKRCVSARPLAMRSFVGKHCGTWDEDAWSKAVRIRGNSASPATVESAVPSIGRPNKLSAAGEHAQTVSSASSWRTRSHKRAAMASMPLARADWSPDGGEPWTRLRRPCKNSPRTSRSWRQAVSMRKASTTAIMATCMSGSTSNRWPELGATAAAAQPTRLSATSGARRCTRRTQVVVATVVTQFSAR